MKIKPINLLQAFGFGVVTMGIVANYNVGGCITGFILLLIGVFLSLSE